MVTFPRSSCRPRIWARKTPVPIKILGTRPKKPRRFFGAISPRYIGTTLKEMPAANNAEKKVYIIIRVAKIEVNSTVQLLKSKKSTSKKMCLLSATSYF